MSSCKIIIKYGKGDVLESKEYDINSDDFLNEFSNVINNASEIANLKKTNKIYTANVASEELSNNTIPIKSILAKNPSTKVQNHIQELTEALKNLSESDKAVVIYKDNYGSVYSRLYRLEKKLNEVGADKDSIKEQMMEIVKSYHQNSINKAYSANVLVKVGTLSKRFNIDYDTAIKSSLITIPFMQIYYSEEDDRSQDDRYFPYHPSMVGKNTYEYLSVKASLINRISSVRRFAIKGTIKDGVINYDPTSRSVYLIEFNDDATDEDIIEALSGKLLENSPKYSMVQSNVAKANNDGSVKWDMSMLYDYNEQKNEYGNYDNENTTNQIISANSIGVLISGRKQVGLDEALSSGNVIISVSNVIAANNNKAFIDDNNKAGTHSASTFLNNSHRRALDGNAVVGYVSVENGKIIDLQTGEEVNIDLNNAKELFEKDGIKYYQIEKVVTEVLTKAFNTGVEVVIRDRASNKIIAEASSMQYALVTKEKTILLDFDDLFIKDGVVDEDKVNSFLNTNHSVKINEGQANKLNKKSSYKFQSGDVIPLALISKIDKSVAEEFQNDFFTKVSLVHNANKLKDIALEKHRKQFVESNNLNDVISDSITKIIKLSAEELENTRIINGQEEVTNTITYKDLADILGLSIDELKKYADPDKAEFSKLVKIITDIIHEQGIVGISDNSSFVYSINKDGQLDKFRFDLDPSQFKSLNFERFVTIKSDDGYGDTTPEYIKDLDENHFTFTHQDKDYKVPLLIKPRYLSVTDKKINERQVIAFHEDNEINRIAGIKFLQTLGIKINDNADFESVNNKVIITFRESLINTKFTNSEKDNRANDFNTNKIIVGSLSSKTEGDETRYIFTTHFATTEQIDLSSTDANTKKRAKEKLNPLVSMVKSFSSSVDNVNNDSHKVGQAFKEFNEVIKNERVKAFIYLINSIQSEEQLNSLEDLLEYLNKNQLDDADKNVIANLGDLLDGVTSTKGSKSKKDKKTITDKNIFYQLKNYLDAYESDTTINIKRSLSETIRSYIETIREGKNSKITESDFGTTAKLVFKTDMSFIKEVELGTEGITYANGNTKMTLSNVKENNRNKGKLYFPLQIVTEITKDENDNVTVSSYLSGFNSSSNTPVFNVTYSDGKTVTTKEINLSEVSFKIKLDNKLEDNPLETISNEIHNAVIKRFTLKHSSKEEQEKLKNKKVGLLASLDKEFKEINFTPLLDKIGDNLKSVSSKNTSSLTFDVSNLSGNELSEVTLTNLTQNNLRVGVSLKLSGSKDELLIENEIDESTIRQDARDLLKENSTTILNEEDNNIQDEYDDFDFDATFKEERETLGLSVTEDFVKSEVEKVFGNRVSAEIVNDLSSVFSNVKLSGIPLGIAKGLSITLDKKADADVLYHEMMHIVFNSFLSSKEKEFALDEMYAKYNISIPAIQSLLERRNLSIDVNSKEARDLYLEELLADEYAKFKANKGISKLTSYLQYLFRKLMRFIGFSNHYRIDDLFRAIDKGKYRDAQINFSNNEIKYNVLKASNSISTIKSEDETNTTLESETYISKKETSLIAFYIFRNQTEDLTTSNYVEVLNNIKTKLQKSIDFINNDIENKTRKLTTKEQSLKSLYERVLISINKIINADNIDLRDNVTTLNTEIKRFKLITKTQSVNELTEELEADGETAKEDKWDSTALTKNVEDTASARMKKFVAGLTNTKYYSNLSTPEYDQLILDMKAYYEGDFRNNLSEKIREAFDKLYPTITKVLNNNTDIESLLISLKSEIKENIYKGLVEPVLKHFDTQINSVIITNPLNEGLVYNGLTKIMVGFDPTNGTNFIDRLNYFADRFTPSLNPLTEFRDAFVEQFFEKDENGNWSKIPTKNVSLYNDIVKFFDKDITEYVNVFGNTYKLSAIKATERTKAESLINRFQTKDTVKGDEYVKLFDTFFNNCYESLNKGGLVQLNLDFNEHYKKLKDKGLDFPPLYLYYSILNHFKNDSKLGVEIQQELKNFDTSRKPLTLFVNKDNLLKCEESSLIFKADTTKVLADAKSKTKGKEAVKETNTALERRKTIIKEKTALKTLLYDSTFFDIEQPALNVKDKENNPRSTIVQSGYVFKRLRDLKNQLKENPNATIDGIKISDLISDDAKIYQALYLAEKHSWGTENSQIDDFDTRLFMMYQQGLYDSIEEVNTPNGKRLTKLYSIGQLEASKTNMMVRLPFTRYYANGTSLTDHLPAIKNYLKLELLPILDNFINWHQGFNAAVYSGYNDIDSVESKLDGDYQALSLVDKYKYLKSKNLLGKLRGFQLFQNKPMLASIEDSLMEYMLTQVAEHQSVKFNEDDRNRILNEMFDKFNEELNTSINNDIESYTELRVKQRQEAMGIKSDYRVKIEYNNIEEQHKDYIRNTYINDMIEMGKYHILMFGSLAVSFKEPYIDFVKRLKSMNALGAASDVYRRKIFDEDIVYHRLQDKTLSVEEQLQSVIDKETYDSLSKEKRALYTEQEASDGQSKHTPLHRLDLTRSMLNRYENGNLGYQIYTLSGGLLWVEPTKEKTGDLVFEGDKTTTNNYFKIVPFDKDKHLNEFNSVHDYMVAIGAANGSMKTVTTGKSSIDAKGFTYDKCSEYLIMRNNVMTPKQGQEERITKIFADIFKLFNQYKPSEREIKINNKSVWKTIDDLFIELHDLYDVIPGQEKEYKKLKIMETEGVDQLVHPSAAKGEKVSKNKITFVDAGIKRFQHEVPVNKEMIVAGTQRLQEIVREQLNSTKVLLNGKSTLIGEVLNYYNELLGNNFLLENNINLSEFTFINENGFEETDYGKIAEALQSSMLRDDVPFNTRMMLSINPETKAFNTKVDLPFMYYTFLNSITSLIGKQYQLKVNGDAYALVSDDAYTVLEDENGKNIPLHQRHNIKGKPRRLKAYFEFRDKSGNIVNVKKDKEGNYEYDEDNIQKLLVYEVVIPAQSEEDKKAFYEGNFTTDYFNNEAYNMLGFRIPTQEKHSMTIARVVDMIDPSYGSVMIVPAIKMPIDGHDKDIDKMFTHKFKTYWNNNTQVIYGNWIKDIESNPLEAYETGFNELLEYLNSIPHLNKKISKEALYEAKRDYFSADSVREHYRLESLKVIANSYGISTNNKTSKDLYEDIFNYLVGSDKRADEYLNIESEIEIVKMFLHEEESKKAYDENNGKKINRDDWVIRISSVFANNKELQDLNQKRETLLNDILSDVKPEFKEMVSDIKKDLIKDDYKDILKYIKESEDYIINRNKLLIEEYSKIMNLGDTLTIAYTNTLSGISPNLDIRDVNKLFNYKWKNDNDLLKTHFVLLSNSYADKNAIIPASVTMSESIRDISYLEDSGKTKYHYTSEMVREKAALDNLTGKLNVGIMATANRYHASLMRYGFKLDSKIYPSINLQLSNLKDIEADDSISIKNTKTKNNIQEVAIKFNSFDETTNKQKVLEEIEKQLIDLYNDYIIKVVRTAIPLNDDLTISYSYNGKDYNYKIKQEGNDFYINDNFLFTGTLIQFKNWFLSQQQTRNGFKNLQSLGLFEDEEFKIKISWLADYKRVADILSTFTSTATDGAKLDTTGTLNMTKEVGSLYATMGVLGVPPLMIYRILTTPIMREIAMSSINGKINKEIVAKMEKLSDSLNIKDTKDIPKLTNLNQLFSDKPSDSLAILDFVLQFSSIGYEFSRPNILNKYIDGANADTILSNDLYDLYKVYGNKLRALSIDMKDDKSIILINSLEEIKLLEEKTTFKYLGRDYVKTKLGYEELYLLGKEVNDKFKKVLTGYYTELKTVFRNSLNESNTTGVVNSTNNTKNEMLNRYLELIEQEEKEFVINSLAFHTFRKAYKLSHNDEFYFLTNKEAFAKFVKFQKNINNSKNNYARVFTSESMLRRITDDPFTALQIVKMETDVKPIIAKNTIRESGFNESFETYFNRVVNRKPKTSYGDMSGILYSMVNNYAQVGLEYLDSRIEEARKHYKDNPSKEISEEDLDELNDLEIVLYYLYDTKLKPIVSKSDEGFNKFLNYLDFNRQGKIGVKTNVNITTAIKESIIIDAFNLSSIKVDGQAYGKEFLRYLLEFYIRRDGLSMKFGSALNMLPYNQFNIFNNETKVSGNTTIQDLLNNNVYYFKKANALIESLHAIILGTQDDYSLNDFTIPGINQNSFYITDTDLLVDFEEKGTSLITVPRYLKVNGVVSRVSSILKMKEIDGVPQLSFEDDTAPFITLHKKEPCYLKFTPLVLNNDLKFTSPKNFGVNTKASIKPLGDGKIELTQGVDSIKGVMVSTSIHKVLFLPKSEIDLYEGYTMTIGDEKYFVSSINNNVSEKTFKIFSDNKNDELYDKNNSIVILSPVNPFKDNKSLKVKDSFNMIDEIIHTGVTYNEEELELQKQKLNSIAKSMAISNQLVKKQDKYRKLNKQLENENSKEEKNESKINTLITKQNDLVREVFKLLTDKSIIDYVKGLSISNDSNEWSGVIFEEPNNAIVVTFSKNDKRSFVTYLSGDNIAQKIIDLATDNLDKSILLPSNLGNKIKKELKTIIDNNYDGTIPINIKFNGKTSFKGKSISFNKKDNRNKLIDDLIIKGNTTETIIKNIKELFSNLNDKESINLSNNYDLDKILKDKVLDVSPIVDELENQFENLGIKVTRNENTLSLQYFGNVELNKTKTTGTETTGVVAFNASENTEPKDEELEKVKFMMDNSTAFTGIVNKLKQSFNETLREQSGSQYMLREIINAKGTINEMENLSRNIKSAIEQSKSNDTNLGNYKLMNYFYGYYPYLFESSNEELDKSNCKK